MLPSNRHRVYVSGELAPHLLADVIHLLSKESLEESYGFVMYDNPSHSWQPALEQMLQTQEIASLLRQFYRLREPSSKAPSPLPEPITIGRIDETMVRDTTLVNRDRLLEEIHSESPSLEHFFRQNFGFCARDGQQLVAWCLADAVIRYAFTQGATEIGWHCWAANTPSVATALKLGFQKGLDYPVCYGHY